MNKIFSVDSPPKKQKFVSDNKVQSHAYAGSHTTISGKTKIICFYMNKIFSVDSPPKKQKFVSDNKVQSHAYAGPHTTISGNEINFCPYKLALFGLEFTPQTPNKNLMQSRCTERQFCLPALFLSLSLSLLTPFPQQNTLYTTSTLSDRHILRFIN